MLRSAQVYLAPLSITELPQLFDWINEREQVLFNAPYYPVTESKHKQWFENVQQRNDIVIFGIRLLENNKLIGTCQLHSIQNIHRSAELQIRLGEVSERSKGYGTEAIDLLLNFAFKDLNLNRVYLHVFSTNIRAIRVYEKCGFIKEGIWRQGAYIDGQYLDVVAMAILKKDWLKVSQDS